LQKAPARPGKSAVFILPEAHERRIRTQIGPQYVSIGTLFFQCFDFSLAHSVFPPAEHIQQFFRIEPGMHDHEQYLSKI
jgi:hypothetical protein